MEHRASPSASLTRTAIAATLHGLTGCAMCEVLDLVFGTALGWGALPITARAVALACLFGTA